MGRDASGELAGSMAATLAARGPDSSGIWVSEDAMAAFGHRRLSIIDLSPGGHQPMISADGRMVITFNGEIYNYRELRGELEKSGHHFRSNSDTEVLLEACRSWGVHATARRLNGIFAFAIWDNSQRVLTLVRDHLGVKPLYWGHFGDSLVFGSQLKALRPFPNWHPEIDRDALSVFFQLSYIPAPHTIYRDVYKLKPGHILTWIPGGTPREEIYWDLREVAQNGTRNPLTLDLEEAGDQLESLLRDAIRGQMMSDVPLGAFLSGGIDSSTVVALMQAQSTSRVKTFSIGFREEQFNEAEYAKSVAAHLDTDHTELYVEPHHALAVIPKLSEWFDEPFADPSQIPTYLLSEMTRRQVTVSLSGDGGDELFAGYRRYFQANRIQRITGWIPPSLRHLGAAAIRSISLQTLNRAAAVLPHSIRPSNFGQKTQKFAELLELNSSDEIFRRLITHWRDAVVLDVARADCFSGTDIPSVNLDPFCRMQLLESILWLPEDVLAKVDRASMAFGLEARVPLLDPRVVEFAWHLPTAFKAHHGKGKRLLRKVLYKYVPQHLVERPKMGFGVPIAAWLRGPLRDWSEDLLDEQRLRQEGLLDAELVRKRWVEHQSGMRNWESLLWDVLMFQAWNQRWNKPSFRLYSEPLVTSH